MSQEITATFENGVLRPDEALDLLPGTKVRLNIAPLADGDGTALDACDELDRLCDEYPLESKGVRLTRDQLHERR